MLNVLIHTSLLKNVPIHFACYYALSEIACVYLIFKLLNRGIILRSSLSLILLLLQSIRSIKEEKKEDIFRIKEKRNKTIINNKQFWALRSRLKPKVLLIFNIFLLVTIIFYNTLMKGSSSIDIIDKIIIVPITEEIIYRVYGDLIGDVFIYGNIQNGNGNINLVNSLTDNNNCPFNVFLIKYLRRDVIAKFCVHIIGAYIFAVSHRRNQSNNIIELHREYFLENSIVSPFFAGLAFSAVYERYGFEMVVTLHSMHNIISYLIGGVGEVHIMISYLNEGMTASFYFILYLYVNFMLTKFEKDILMSF